MLANSMDAGPIQTRLGIGTRAGFGKVGNTDAGPCGMTTWSWPVSGDTENRLTTLAHSTESDARRVGVPEGRFVP